MSVSLCCAEFSAVRDTVRDTLYACHVMDHDWPTSRWARAFEDTRAQQGLWIELARLPVAAALTFSFRSWQPQAVDGPIAVAVLGAGAIALTFLVQYLWHLARADYRIAQERLVEALRENERLAAVAATAHHREQLADALQERVAHLEDACTRLGVQTVEWTKAYNEQAAGTPVPLAAVLHRIERATQVKAGALNEQAPRS